MTATAFPAFMDALVTALRLRAGLSGVRVFSAPLADPREAGEEAIILAPETTITQVQAAMSSLHIEETFDVKGLIICNKPQKRGTDPVATINAAAKVARDRAVAIFGEVVAQLDSDATVSSTVLDARTTEIVIQQGAAPEAQLGRMCQLEFTIAAEAHTTP